ncbi:MAG: pyrimidine dimer DNA glycosylase/endonuclease V, partial [Bacillota bacterium]
MMRVWDIHPGYLDRGGLLGQHAEIHAVWSVLR